MSDRRLPPTLPADGDIQHTLQQAIAEADAGLAPGDGGGIRPTRRGFIKGSVAAGAALLAAGSLGRRALAADDDLGVASGNPRPDSVVLWTRIPDRFQPAGTPLAVYFEVATDPSFSASTIVTEGQTFATSSADYTVRVRAEGLTPFTTYYYRFYTQTGFESVWGRTLTAPHENALPAEVRFAFVSCSNHNGRKWNVYDALASRDEVHYCVHLGDNVYESGLGYPARDLSDWRALHKLYLELPELREVRRLFPWVHTWDDHEVFNNHCGGDMTEAERAIQAAAYQAFSEFMPLDPEIQLTSRDGIAELKIYRKLTFGRLFEFFVTDGRQYRDGVVCGRDFAVSACDDLYDPERTMLGREQTDWLKDELDASEATWKFILNGTVMMAMKLSNKVLPIFARYKGDNLRETSEGLVINLDQWDGYPANRKEILEWVEDRSISNVVVLTGDIHNCYAGQLKSDFTRQHGRRVAGVELVTGSVTSSGAAETLGGYDASELMYKAFQPANPHIDYVDGYYHVYTRVTVRPDRIESTYVAVSTITSADYEVFELDTLSVEAGSSKVIVEPR